MTWIPRSVPASTRRLVRARSSWLGCGAPEGWLWQQSKAAALLGCGIAQDGGLQDFARMDHAGGQRPDRHGVDTDNLVFLIQHGHQEVFAVHGAEVLTEEEC